MDEQKTFDLNLGESLIMPSLTIHIPMPQGAAAPAPPPTEPPPAHEADNS